jgi:uncharacterized protein with PIN domain
MNKKLLLIPLTVSLMLLAGCSRTKPLATDDVMMQKDVAMQKENTMDHNDAMMKDDAMKDKEMMAMTGKRTKEEMKKMEHDGMMKNDTMKKDDAMVQKSPATYITYSENAAKAALVSGKKVALFFSASRCPSCRGLDKDLTADIATLPANTVVFKVDYDNSADMKKLYGVTSQHTIVTIDTDMKMIAKNTGANVAKIIQMLQ